MSKIFRGIFPVLQTPLTEDGQLDIDSMKKEVNFCIQAGAHGLVYPVLGGEFQFLSKEERQRMVEVVVSEANGRAPVVTGVADVNKDGAVDHTRHAAKTGSDAVIALPPSNAAGKKDEIREYYESIAQTAGNIPVFIQHTHSDMDVAMLLHLLEIENIQYIKEEMHPSAHQISALLEKVGDTCQGVFGGAHGRWMLSELHRGASGFMPAAEMTDIHVQIWNAYHSGDETGARKIFNRLLPLINLITILGLRVCKEVLVRRGVIKSANMRIPGTLSLDTEDERELSIIIEDLKPLLRIKNPCFISG
jgi:dihydrodipicolinate synthase/N-acetylneuraminate lyase